MIGRRKAQVPLFHVGNVFPVKLDPGSFHGQLAAVAPRLFQDEDFASFYSQRRGRPSVPPSQLAVLLLLQHQAQVSDSEAIERSSYDLRWAAVLGREAGTALCAKSTLQLFRSHLILHEGVQTIFRRSIEEAKRSGLLKAGPLRIAMDTKPILGRGAVEDTYNLLATGIRSLARALSQRKRQSLEQFLSQTGLELYGEPSLKGAAAIDWSDEAARQQLLGRVVADARKLMSLAQEGMNTGSSVPANPTTVDPKPDRIRQAAHLLEELLLQDLEELPPSSPSASGLPGPSSPPSSPSASGLPGPSSPPSSLSPNCVTEPLSKVGPPVRVKEGIARDRKPSATDPEQRHGRKNRSQRFCGHKAAIATDTHSQIITAVEVLPGNAPDAEQALPLVQQTEHNTGEDVALTIGDCAYGGGPTRESFAEAGRELVARAPKEHERTDGTGQILFPKSAFTIAADHNSVTCSAGEVATRFTLHNDGGKIFYNDGGKIFYFGRACATCALRTQCVGESVRSVGARQALRGRTLKVHPQESLLERARQLQHSQEGRALFLLRQVVEHRLARLAQLGIGQARYCGRTKTHFQLMLAAAIANFRRTWRWQQSHSQEPAATPGVSPQPGAPWEALVERCYTAVVSWLAHSRFTIRDLTARKVYQTELR